MKKFIILLLVTLLSACRGEPLPEVLSTFIIQNNTNSGVEIKLYSHNAKDSLIQLEINGTCEFNYFSMNKHLPYSMPLNEYDSLDIKKGDNIDRFKYKDHTGPFDMYNYLSIDTIVKKERKKCDYYRYNFKYIITEER